MIPEGGGGGSIAETASHHIWMVISVSRVLQIGMEFACSLVCRNGKCGSTSLCNFHVFLISLFIYFLQKGYFIEEKMESRSGSLCLSKNGDSTQAKDDVLLQGSHVCFLIFFRFYIKDQRVFHRLHDEVI